MLETVQPEQPNKTNDPKQQGKEKTCREKIMLDTVQPEQQNKTMIRNDKEKRKHTSRR